MLLQNPLYLGAVGPWMAHGLAGSGAWGAMVASGEARQGTAERLIELHESEPRLWEGLGGSPDSAHGRPVLFTFPFADGHTASKTPDLF